MVHPYVANTINALILIVAGLAAYFLLPDRPQVALIAPAFGVLLLACTHHLRKHNRFVFNTVSALTLLAGFALVTRINLDTFMWDGKHVLLLVMGASCFLAVASYVATFVRERRMGNNTVYKDDL